MIQFAEDSGHNFHCALAVAGRLPAERSVAISGRLTLISGTGSALGPLLGSSVMSMLGIRGLFHYLAVAVAVAVAALFAAFALARGLSVRPPAFKRRRPSLLVHDIFAHRLAHASEGPRAA
jgi:hypothetical protein